MPAPDIASDVATAGSNVCFRRSSTPNSPEFSEVVVAETDDKVGESIADGYYRDTLTVIQLIKLEDSLDPYTTLLNRSWP